MFPSLLITGTWWRGRVDDDLSLSHLRQELLRQTQLLRQATRGESCSVQALLAFTGLVLEEGTAIHLPFGVLREVAESERELSPGMLEGRVTHTTAEGEEVTATYSGDIVLDSEIQYRIDVRNHDAFETYGDWPDELRAFDVLGRNIDSLRLAVLLSGDDESPLQLGADVADGLRSALLGTAAILERSETRPLHRSTSPGSLPTTSSAGQPPSTSTVVQASTSPFVEPSRRPPTGWTKSMLSSIS